MIIHELFIEHKGLVYIQDVIAGVNALHMKYGLDIVNWPGMPGLILTPIGFRKPPMLGLIPIMPGMLKANPAAAKDMFCWRLMLGTSWLLGPGPARLAGGSLAWLFSGEPPLGGESSSVLTWEQEDMCDGQ